jgi:hypothetical protein
MQALRQIVEVKNHSLSILLPDSFNTNKVEVIVLSVEETTIPKNSIAKLRGKLKLSNEQRDEFQQYVIESRSEWDRNI